MRQFLIFVGSIGFLLLWTAGFGFMATGSLRGARAVVAMVVRHWIALLMVGGVIAALFTFPG